MNPVLLKPNTDIGAQVIVHGRSIGNMDADVYHRFKPQLLGKVLSSFDRLKAGYDHVVIEGAGSPAEINLREHDIANMGFARAANVPVCLLGDIDRGGVIAALAGTRAVLDAADAAMITCFAVNKFRGDPALFADGVREIERRTGWPCRGVIPWLPAARRLPAEDAVVLDTRDSVAASARDTPLRIAAPLLSRIANHDDADPLRMEPGVDFRFVPPGTPVPRDVDVIALLGTKSTLGELAFLRAQGWDHDVIAHARAGGRVIGLCGGLQMLGRRIHDPHGVDGPPGEAPGLGLLQVDTVMSREKTVRPSRGHCARSGAPIEGYEIHMGDTSGPDTARPFAHLEHGADGAVSADGRIAGSYLHGLFASDAFRAAWLDSVRPGSASRLAYETELEQALDELADGVEAALDLDALIGDT